MGQEIVNAFIAVSAALGFSGLLAYWFKARIARKEADHTRQLTKEEQREADMTAKDEKILQLSIELAACLEAKKFWHMQSERSDVVTRQRADHDRAEQQRTDGTNNATKP